MLNSYDFFHCFWFDGIQFVYTLKEDWFTRVKRHLKDKLRSISLILIIQSFKGTIRNRACHSFFKAGHFKFRIWFPLTLETLKLCIPSRQSLRDNSFWLVTWSIKVKYYTMPGLRSGICLYSIFNPKRLILISITDFLKKNLIPSF